MTLAMRRYGGEDDYWRIRAFLRKVMILNDRREWSWHVARLDYWRWHVVGNMHHGLSLEDAIFIWEIAEGKIGAVLNPEGGGEAHFQVHPGWCTPALEVAMLETAESHLSQTNDDGTKSLVVWVDGGDTGRQEMLAGRGYTRGEWPENQRRRALDTPIPDAPAPPGYTVRSLGDVDELPARSWASWRAFHPDAPDSEYEGRTWYQNIQRMPLYRRDLDIVAAAPGGEIAAFCTIWYDDVTRTAYYEPVGTVPEHQRKGLGKAVMSEGLRRLKPMGAVRAFVGGYSAAANALYAAAGFTDCDLSEPWKKTW